MKRVTIELGLLLMLLVVACSPNEKQEKEEKYMVSTPLMLDTTYTKEYVADVQAIQNVEIRARIKGHVEKLLVDEGQTVRQNQLLFTISNQQFQQELQKAKSTLKSTMAELQSVQIEYQNTQKLSDNNIVSSSQLQMMKAKVDAMKAKVEEVEAQKAQAELNLSFARITAPFDGVINRIPNKTGSLVEDGTLLTTISNTNNVLVYFNVSESTYLDYMNEKANNNTKEVELMLANNELYPYKGKIETIEGQIDKGTGNIAFRANFANPNSLLRHGSSGKVLVKNKVKNAMIIPQKSTFEIQQNLYVFVVDANNIVHMKLIVPRFLRMENLFVIESGLKSTDRILVEGIQLVKDGDKIVPNLIPARQVINSVK